MEYIIIHKGDHYAVVDENGIVRATEDTRREAEETIKEFMEECL